MAAPNEWEHDEMLCGMGWETACPKCRLKMTVPTEEETVGIRSARILIVQALCDITSADPRTTCLALASILRDGMQVLEEK